MTDKPDAAAIEVVREWISSPYETHKRPPYRAHTFDNDGKFYVVGSTTISVPHGFNTSKEFAEIIAGKLNIAARAILESERANIDEVAR